MKTTLKWGLIFGLIAFFANIFLPGCIEPFIAFIAAGLTGALSFQQLKADGAAKMTSTGLFAGLITWGVIFLTDFLLSALLAMGYIYRDKIPWLEQLGIPNVDSVFGNTILAILGVYLCMGIIKMVFSLLGGVAGTVTSGLFIQKKQKIL